MWARLRIPVSDMTIIAVVAEQADETRVAITPEVVKKFKALGCDVRIEAGAGQKSLISDAEYQQAGATVTATAEAALEGADILLAVQRPQADRLGKLKAGAVVAAIFNPYDDKADLEAVAATGVTAFAMEFMPRISRAQSMDVLSSQSNLAGYKAVIDAAAHFTRAMPMMMTAAGTVPPAKVFVMGVGVAGLQAIATAKRLGAVVSATDVRAATKEQVESLGGKFIMVEADPDESGETAGGYAKEMSEDYKRRQAALVAEHIKSQDIVITTALIPGRPAPRLITEEMVKSMKPGAIIVDLAAERGGNVAGTQPGKIIKLGPVTIMGKIQLARELPVNASNLYARNLYAFVAQMIDKETGNLVIDYEDETISGTLLAKDGQIVHPRLTGEKQEAERC